MKKGDNWDRINQANAAKLSEDAKNWDRNEWKAVLRQAPVDALFYALMKQITKMLDTIRLYDKVQSDIDRIYAEDNE